MGVLEFDVDELADFIADHDEEDQRGLVDELVARFEEATGLDSSSVDTSGIEPEYAPVAFDDDPDTNEAERGE